MKCIHLTTNNWYLSVLLIGLVGILILILDNLKLILVVKLLTFAFNLKCLMVIAHYFMLFCCLMLLFGGVGDKGCLHCLFVALCAVLRKSILNIPVLFTANFLICLQKLNINV